LKQRINFILQIGRYLHKYGTNAPRIESALKNISHSLGMKGNYFSTPTYLSISIDDQEEQVVRHLRVNPGEVDLSKLCEVDEIAEQVCDKTMDVKSGLERLGDLENKSRLYPEVLTIFAFGLTSLALAVLFGGGLLDGSFSFIMGSTVGLLGYLCKKSEKLSEIFEFIAAFVCTALTYLCKSKFDIIHFQIVVMSSLIVIIPGLNLTIAMTELAAKNLVSGTARLMGAMVDFFKISFGVMLGHQLGTYTLGKLSPDFALPLPELWHWPALFIGSISFTIIFNARSKDFIWIFFSGFVAIIVMKLSGLGLPSELALFFAGLAVGVASNSFARIFNRPAMLPLLPGIIFLVPGSIGFKGLNLIFQTHYVQGLGNGFKMLIVAMTIVAGLFFANVFVNPRRSL